MRSRDRKQNLPENSRSDWIFYIYTYINQLEVLEVVVEGLMELGFTEIVPAVTHKVCLFTTYSCC